MNVANERFHAIINRHDRPRYVRAIRQFEAPTTLQKLRRDVRSGLLDILEIEPGESRADIQTAGQHVLPGRALDIVLVDLELIHAGQPQQVADDLLRICRSGGRIGLACPAPGSFLAEIHARIELYIAPGAPVASRGFTGTREGLDALFGAGAKALGGRDRSVELSVRSAEHWLAEWQVSYAPLKRAFQSIDPEWRSQLTNDLLDIAGLFAEPRGARLSIRCDYLEFLVHKGDLQ